MSCANLACNIHAIPEAGRARYRALVEAIQLFTMRRDEMDNGYRFELDGAGISLNDLAEWMSWERHCCPFLQIELAISGESPNWALTLTGGDGVKEIVASAFPAR